MSGNEKFLELARQEALKSTCLRSKCGSIIVSNGKIIGRGFNSPPGNLESQRRCKNRKSDYNIKITDKTCCTHAEQRAIFDALKNFPNQIEGSTIYFVRIDSGSKIKPSSKPYCTICSKFALDVGISKWVLMHLGGIKTYDAEKYNDLSFEFDS